MSTTSEELLTRRVSKQGWIGIPAIVFRRAMTTACRLVGIKMLHSRSIFVEADGYDKENGTPLVRMRKERSTTVRVIWDEDQFSFIDIMNLMVHAGLQVEISKEELDNGPGWGSFEVVGL